MFNNGTVEYDYEVSQGMSKKDTDEIIQEFYNELSITGIFLSGVITRTLRIKSWSLLC
ncbi:MAG: hypothetical protein ABOK23_08400 [Candidatus Methanoperedens sp.]|nr:hypothetical protein [Candidatus Methanoperedens sp.]MCZ7396386.1 hypothetical protein [Candidatus Methanoperedens sp.]